MTKNVKQRGAKGRKLLALMAAGSALFSGMGQAAQYPYGVPRPEACVADGKLWYNDTHSLRTLSILTNHRTETIGKELAMYYDESGRPTNSDLVPWDIAWGADGNLYGVSQQGVLFNINPTTGATTRLSQLNTGIRAHNGLSGLPDGRLLVTGQTGYNTPDAITSKIYAVTVNTGGGTTVREWFDARRLTGFNVNGTGDSVVHRGAVYSIMHGAKGANDFYLIRIPINMATSEPNGQASFQKIEGAQYGYGLASLNGELYMVRADFTNQFTSYAKVYKLDFEVSNGELKSASARPLSDEYSTRNNGRTVYGLTARPEPWGGFCPSPAEPELVISKTNYKDAVVAGDTVKYNFTIQNIGKAATNGPIAVKELFGPGMTFESTEIAPGDGTISGGQRGQGGLQEFSINLNRPLGENERRFFSISVKIDPLARGTVVNKATVGGGGAPPPEDPATANCATVSSGEMKACTIDTDTVKAPALSVTKTNNVTAVTSGGTTTYTITITNTGDAPTSGPIQVNELLGDGLGWQTVTIPANQGSISGQVAGRSAQNLTVNPAAPLQPQGTLTLNVVANVTAAGGSSVKNRVTVGGGGTPVAPNPSLIGDQQCTVTCAEDTDTVETPKLAALSIAKTVNPEYILVNSPVTEALNTSKSPIVASRLTENGVLTYIISVANTGNGDATNVVVTDNLPAGLTFGSATLSSGVGVHPAPLNNRGRGQNLSFNVGTIPAGGVATIAVKATVSLPDNTNLSSIVNTASANATGLSQVNSAPARTEVVYSKLSKKFRHAGKDEQLLNPQGAAPQYVTTELKGSVGDYVEYCLVYNNFGSTAIKEYTIEDRLDPHLKFVKVDSIRSTPGTPRVVVQGQRLNYFFTEPLPAGANGQVCFFTQIVNE